jgi:hypothetical protein
LTDNEETDEEQTFAYNDSMLNRFREKTFSSSELNDYEYYVPKALLFISGQPYFSIFSLIQKMLLKTSRESIGFPIE